MSGLRRNPAMQERLDAWGRWLMGGGVINGSSPLAGLMSWTPPTYGEGGSYVPVDSIECSLPDDAVRALPRELREAVYAWHGSSSGTLESVSARLKIVRGTLHRRLCLADLRIAEWFDLRRRRHASPCDDGRVRRDIPDRA